MKSLKTCFTLAALLVVSIFSCEQPATETTEPTPEPISAVDDTPIDTIDIKDLSDSLLIEKYGKVIVCDYIAQTFEVKHDTSYIGNIRHIGEDYFMAPWQKITIEGLKNNKAPQHLLATKAKAHFDNSVVKRLNDWKRVGKCRIEPIKPKDNSDGTWTAK